MILVVVVLVLVVRAWLHGKGSVGAASGQPASLAAPRVPLLEEHVGYIAAARFHDQSLDLPYLAIGRTDGQFAAYVYLAGWDGVNGDFLRGFRSARVAVGPDLAPHRAIPQTPGDSRKKVHARGGVGLLGPAGVEVRHDLGLLGGSERLELG